MEISELNKVCDICRKKIDDPLNCGELMTKSNIIVHYYCLLLSTNLPQKGKDFGGILGFLIADIKAEIEAAKTRFCLYCNEIGASIKCKSKECQKYFHLTCGIANFCQNEFINEFASYCHQHIVIGNEKIPDVDSICRICYERFYNKNPISCIIPNCCEHGFLHNICLKKYALKAGYYFKCIWCKNPEFRDQVREYGIFVPDRDAAWEIEGNMFAGLYENYLYCDAEKCLCPFGRQNIKNKVYVKDWKILVCNTCGSNGVHKLCSKQNINEYTCDNCLSIFRTTILTYNIPTYRSLVVNEYLEINATLNNTNSQEFGNKTLFVHKLPQNTNTTGIDDIYDLFSDFDIGQEIADNKKYRKKLLKFHPTENKVESVILAYVDDPEKGEYDIDECIIIQEQFDDDDLPIDRDLVLRCYNEVMEEKEQQQKLLKNNKEILVEDSDEEAEKSISDLLFEMGNEAGINIPKPIIEK